jgi:DNA-directed RNA polymerase subunit RPC12/RpoP
MPRSTYFVQECPTCGRNLQVRIEYLGKQVVCQHCGARFEACEPGSLSDSGINALLERAEHLLQSSSSGVNPRVMASDVAPARPR